MKINEVEAQVGITKKNIRFYEEQGLLSPRRNSENGYRDYGEEEVKILRQIKLMRKLGVPLEEIRQMVRDGLREEPDGLAKIRCVMETLVADSARYITLTRRIFFLNVSPDSELHEARAELLEILGEALDALLPEERELAVRVVGEEMPVAEFARMKKENRRTLASRRDRVLEKLRLFFEDRGFDVHK